MWRRFRACATLVGGYHWAVNERLRRSSTPPTNIPTMAPATAPDNQLMRCWLAITSRELRPSDSSGRSAVLCWPRPSLGSFQLLRSTPFGRSGKESELLAIALGQGGEQESERELLLLGAFLGGKLIMCVITHPLCETGAVSWVSNCNRGCETAFGCVKHFG